MMQAPSDSWYPLSQDRVSFCSERVTVVPSDSRVNLVVSEKVPPEMMSGSEVLVCGAA